MVRGGGGRAAWRGFTIIEIMVVIVMIAVLSAFVVPRMITNGAREAELEAKQVRLLLTTLAQRDAILGQHMALEFDADKGTLSLLVQTRDEEGVPAEEWTPAPMVKPVVLTHTTMARATRDGLSLGSSAGSGGVEATGSWRFEVDQSQQRGAIGLVLARRSGDGPGGAYQIDLLPSNTAASMSACDSVSAARPPREGAVDLDAGGMREAAW